jgi:hypothetical protein
MIMDISLPSGWLSKYYLMAWNFVDYLFILQLVFSYMQHTTNLNLWLCCDLKGALKIKKLPKYYSKLTIDKIQ